MMKRLILCLSVLVFVGLLGTCTAKAADRVLLKTENTPDSYCHEEFPAIRPSTLDTRRPTLKNSNTGDVIDFYGPCAERPTGKDQVWQQKLDEEQSFDLDYLS
jgi:hypothetical protein